MQIYRQLAALVAAAALACVPAGAQKLSMLPPAATLTGSEPIPAAQGAGCATQASPCGTVATTPAQLSTYILAGTAAASTKLAIARTINGVAFDGSANITVAAVDSTPRVPTSLTIATAAPLSGGGALTGNLALSITAASSSAAGTMSAADKAKLDGIAAGATANTGTVTNVAGTGANGVTVSVTNPTTTPAITIGLGAITPSSAVSPTIRVDGASNALGFYDRSQVGASNHGFSAFSNGDVFHLAFNGAGSDVLTVGSTGALTAAGAIAASNFSGSSSGTNTGDNANTTGSAAKWTTGRVLSFTGDATGSGTVDGSANVATTLTLSATGVTAGAYGSAAAVPVPTIDAKGRITSITTAALGTMATQSAAAVAITGGTATLSGTTIDSNGIKVTGTGATFILADRGDASSAALFFLYVNSGKLYVFKNGTNLASIDGSGNLRVAGTVTGSVTP